MTKNQRSSPLQLFFSLKSFNLLHETLGKKLLTSESFLIPKIFEAGICCMVPGNFNIIVIRAVDMNHDTKIPLSFEKLLPHMPPYPQPPALWHIQHQIWQVSLLQILLCTPASRLDLTVPSSPIKSKALREECVNPVWSIPPYPASVDVAPQQPCCYFHVKTSP